MNNISRNEARSLGLPRYFTGVPCKHGHLDERTVCDGRCISCKNAVHWRWEQANPDKITAYRSRDSWKQSRYNSVKRYNDKESTRQRHATYYLENRESKLNYVKQYAAENPDKPRQHKRNYKARKKDADGYHTAEQINTVGEEQNWLCANPSCRVPILDNYHVDHETPLSRHGTNDIDNIQLLCPTCNHRKGSKPYSAWLREVLPRRNTIHN